MNVRIGRGLRPWRRFAWAALTGLAGALLGLAPAPAAAGSSMVTIPADKFLMAPGGVDMRTGRYAYSQTDLSIGGTEESGGLALTRIMAADVLSHVNPFDNFSDNWDIMVTEKRININDPSQQTGGDYRINVHFGGRSKTFESYSTSNGFTQKGNGPWGSLTFSGDRASASVIYTYTAPDGTVAVFRPLGGGDCSQYRCAYVSTITEPDGTMFTFDYGSSSNITPGAGGAVQLRRVTSSRGYALLLEGTNNLVTKACVLNLALTAAPANGLCPSNAAATATYAYTNLQRLASVTRPGGAVESFTFDGGTMGFIKPGQTTPWLTNYLFLNPDEEGVRQELVGAQTFADGQSYSYSYNFTPITDSTPAASVMGGVYTDALGNETTVAYDFPLTPGQPGSYCVQFPCQDVSPSDDLNRSYQVTPGPVRTVDPLGRTTTADYCDPAAEVGLPYYEPNRCIVVPMVSFTDPEGIKTDLSYDGSLNITRAVRHAKAGSGLPDVVTSATYDVNHPKSHDKPLTTTDANGNTTIYTYDPNHGGVLTETDPAVNGVTPQKRYTYAQRYAWISDGGLGFVRAATPVWVLTQMSFCKAGNPSSSGVGCANGASDEVITTYDYGPDSGPNNLNLRGTVVDAGGLSLRSCTSYDVLGNKISETKPRAGLASCP